MTTSYIGEGFVYFAAASGIIFMLVLASVSAIEGRRRPDRD